MKNYAIAMVAGLLIFNVPGLYARGSRSGGRSRTYKASGTGSNPRSTHVRGHSNRNGTYTQPHRRSVHNNTKNDNWSTNGNINPYTGKEGTRDPNR